MINFFREDLELNKKWWHRLFKILFILSLLIFIGKFYLIFLEESENHYKEIDKLENRLTDKVSKIEDLLKIGEKFTYTNWGTKDDLWNKDIYCSNKLYDITNLEYIISIAGINTFYDDFRNQKLSIEEFSDFLKKENRKCLIVDKVWSEDFLNPMEQFNDFGFYEKSLIQYFKDSIFLGLFLMSLIFYIILMYIFYYWIIVYIIYGRNNNSK